MLHTSEQQNNCEWLFRKNVDLFTYLIAYVLFNDVSSSDYILSNYRMINE
jgi:hypothetical protein